MVLKVFGTPVSTCTGRVLACIEELGLKYELIPIDLNTGEHKRPPHTDRNPFGQIPALQDGDLVLFGDFYSLADLHHLTYGHYLTTSTPHGSLIHSRPHVKAWWDAISSRPASKKVLTALSFSS